MIRRLLALGFVIPVFALFAGCENSEGAKSPTSVKVDTSKDVQPPADIKPSGAAKGTAPGVIKSPD